MAVAMKDIRAIIEGSSIEIQIPNPFEEGVKWFMRQPEDWEADLALAVRGAAIAHAHEQPEIKAVAHLPPSKTWIARHHTVAKAARERILELEAQGESIDPLDRIELENQRDLLESLADPESYTRADELVTAYCRKRHEEWLITRLVFSEAGKVYFDPDTEEGTRRWKKLKSDLKIALKLVLYNVQNLETTAKN